MLRLPDSGLVLSATDITSNLACEHLFEQRRAVAFRERGKPRPVDDPHGELVKERGDDHERAQLAVLERELGTPVDLSSEPVYTRQGLEHEAARAAQAMRDGAPLIFQAQLFDGRWQGRTDFLRRVDGIHSALGDYAYEVGDSKLSRAVKPAVVHQLSLYGDLLAKVQGHRPTEGFVLLGDGTEERIDLTRYAALHAHVRSRVERRAASSAIPTYPEPVAHCAICDYAIECHLRRRADDHLSLVANARREQRARLLERGLPTLTALAEAPEDFDAGKLGPDQYGVLHHQARLQRESYATRLPTRRHRRPVEHARGYARLPAPSRGDVFFDLEGDPFLEGEGGLEYLWGWTTADGEYHHVWAGDLAGEKAALEAFLRAVAERRAAHPDMHVFHYAPHEASKLSSLALRHATMEDEVDDLLRNDVLVDLLAVVRQGVQVGEESYSLKRLERHHGFVRKEMTVREGGGSIIAYETYLATGDETLREAIRAYNEEDCRSTHSLRDWLLNDLLPEAEAELGVQFADYAEPQPAEPHEPPGWLVDQQALVARLSEGLPVDPADDLPAQATNRMLSHLLLYHWREAKPEWWRFFDLCDKSAAELIEERDAVGCLKRDETVAPVAVKRSLEYEFTFPPQEVKLSPGGLLDPTDGEGHTLTAIGDGRLTLRRGNTKPAPDAKALIGTGPLNTEPLRKSLAATAKAVLDGNVAAPAALSLLRRASPQMEGGAPFRDDGYPTIETMCEATVALRGSHLVVQGPPGTGKTYRGARMIVAAMRAGRCVGITSQSHAAIHNLLDAVEEHANEIGFDFRGVYKGHGYESAHDLVEVVDDNEKAAGEFDLFAGTAWLFARTEQRAKLGVLFIDEAGQFSLANAIAIAPATDSIVLLGDPQQLPQVTQAKHPGTSGASVLEHLLGDAATIGPTEGFFLPESWRMHPDVCAFVSERSYDGRLRSRDACGVRNIAASGELSGVGLRTLAVEHEGNSQRSDEEAAAIGAACRDLLADGVVTDEDGVSLGLAPEDIMVVAPYNLAVECIAAAVPAGVQVGTVDRFQGREAPVVFFAMTCSSGEDVPRGLDFLFSRNRLNVAISRAQCLAVLVHAPRLLDADCRSLEAMELLDGVCRFVEMATPAFIGEARTANSVRASIQHAI